MKTINIQVIFKQHFFNFAMTAMTLLFSNWICGQTDTKARALLDQLSAKTKMYSAMKADFNYLLDNNAENIHETQSGTIILKGEKYFLKIAGQEIRCDEKTIWTYLKDAEEVQVSEVDPENKSAISPTRIFTMYEKGFRHQYIKDEVIAGSNIAEIHIFPTDVNDKSYHTIKLFIDKTKMELQKIIIVGKEGETYTYKIKSFIGNVSVSDDEFVFNPKNHPDVELIDLR